MVEIEQQCDKCRKSKVTHRMNQGECCGQFFFLILSLPLKIKRSNILDAGKLYQ